MGRGPVIDRIRDWALDPLLEQDLSDDLYDVLEELERLYKLEKRLLHAIELLEKAGI